MTPYKSIPYLKWKYGKKYYAKIEELKASGLKSYDIYKALKLLTNKEREEVKQ